MSNTKFQTDLLVDEEVFWKKRVIFWSPKSSSPGHRNLLLVQKTSFGHRRLLLATVDLL